MYTIYLINFRNLLNLKICLKHKLILILMKLYQKKIEKKNLDKKKSKKHMKHMKSI